MPIFIMHTNVCQSAIPSNLMSDLCQLLEKAMGMPGKYFAINIQANQQMMFGNTSHPCAVCSLKSIANIGGPQNEKYSKLLCEILNKELNISPERIYIDFIPANNANIGWQSTTLAKLEL